MSSNKDFSERMGISEGNESMGITGDRMSCPNESLDSFKSDCFVNWGENIRNMDESVTAWFKDFWIFRFLESGVPFLTLHHHYVYTCYKNKQYAIASERVFRKCLRAYGFKISYKCTRSQKGVFVSWGEATLDRWCALRAEKEQSLGLL